MINGTLFRREIKANAILFVIFIAVITMYAVIVVMMFEPELGSSLQVMAESMPEIFAAFGMAEVGTTLLEFITGYLYGLIMPLFPAIFTLILCNRLIARYVSDGSMAYLLAAPVKRQSVVTTQAVYLTAILSVMLLYSAVMIWTSAAILFPGDLDNMGFVRVNVGLFGLIIFLAGICFLVSCICNDSKRVSAVNSAIVIYSFLVQMLSQVGEKFEVLKYATPLTLFNAGELSAGTSGAWSGIVLLYAVGILLIVIGIRIFSKRNLPL